eukprot:scaffold13603_cov112-Isochrysis_galbana.AAC.13
MGLWAEHDGPGRGSLRARKIRKQRSRSKTEEGGGEPGWAARLRIGGVECDVLAHGDWEGSGHEAAVCDRQSDVRCVRGARRDAIEERPEGSVVGRVAALVAQVIVCPQRIAERGGQLGQQHAQQDEPVGVELSPRLRRLGGKHEHLRSPLELRKRKRQRPRWRDEGGEGGGASRGWAVAAWKKGMGARRVCFGGRGARRPLRIERRSVRGRCACLSAGGEAPVHRPRSVPA